MIRLICPSINKAKAASLPESVQTDISSESEVRELNKFKKKGGFHAAIPETLYFPPSKKL